MILECLLLCYFADGPGPPRGRHSVASELSVPGIDRDNSSVSHVQVWGQALQHIFKCLTLSSILSVKALDLLLSLYLSTLTNTC